MMSGFETLSLRNTKQLAQFRSIDLKALQIFAAVLSLVLLPYTLLRTNII
jgi:hypothetical protein